MVPPIETVQDLRLARGEQKHVVRRLHCKMGGTSETSAQ